MAVLVRRVASILKRSFGRSLVPFLEATEAIARCQAASLLDCMIESAHFNDATPGTSFDVYLSVKVSDVPSAILKTIHQALIHAGHRPCHTRYQLTNPADVADLILCSRRFVLILTTNMFKSFWVMRELHDAILTGADIVLVLIEGERWGGERIEEDATLRTSRERISSNSWLGSEKFEPATSRPEVHMALSAMREHFPDAPAAVLEGVKRLFGQEYQARVVHQSSIYADSFSCVLNRMVGVPLSIRRKLATFGLDYDKHLEAAVLLQAVAEINSQDPTVECEVKIQTRGDPSSLTIVQRNRSDLRVLRHLSAANFLQHVDTCRAIVLSHLKGFHESKGNERDSSNRAMDDEGDRDTHEKAAYLARKESVEQHDDSEEELYLVTESTETSTQTGISQSSSESNLVAVVGFDVGLLKEPTQLRQVLREALIEVIYDIKLQLKPLLAFIQIQGSYGRPARSSGSEFEWPEAGRKLIAAFNGFNFDFILDGVRDIRIRTRGAINVANMTLFTTTAFGALVIGIYVGACVISSALAHRNPRRAEDTYDKAVKTVVLFLFICYPAISLELFKLYQTRRYGHVTLLVADWSLGYEDTSAPISLLGYQMIAVPFLCLWVVGIPVFFFAELWKTARPHAKPKLNLQELKALDKLQVW